VHVLEGGATLTFSSFSAWTFCSSARCRAAPPPRAQIALAVDEELDVRAASAANRFVTIAARRR